MKKTRTEVIEMLKKTLIIYSIITTLLLIYVLGSSYEICINKTCYKQNIFQYMIGQD